MKFLLITLIEFYCICISPLYPPCCRFYPSCSAYAKEALLTHGVFKGSFFSIMRILRCHPFSDGGYDPVPPINYREITHGK
jgi:putative membrane protein insertion efficiency factor